MIDVGEVERNSGCAVFKTLNLGRALNLIVLQLPPYRSLSSCNNKKDFIFNFATSLPRYKKDCYWRHKTTKKIM